MLVDIDFVQVPVDLHTDGVLLAGDGDIAIDQTLHVEILLCPVIVVAHCFDQDQQPTLDQVALYFRGKDISGESNEDIYLFSVEEDHSEIVNHKV